MTDILLVVLPVFLVLTIGYAGARSGYLNPSISEHLNSFAVKLAVPALLFRAMYRLDFAQAFQPQMLLAFYAGAMASFIVGIVLARLVWKRRPGEAVVVGFSAMFSNTVLLGLPIFERAYGTAGLTPVFGIVSLHAPLLYAIGMTTMELSRRDGRPLSQAFGAAARSILANPLMIGILAGASANLAGIALPEPVMASADLLAAAAIPAALVGIGAALARYRLQSQWPESLMVSVLTLLLHPAVAFALAWFVFALPPEQVRAAVVLAAMPPGMNIYIFAVMYDRAAPLAASAILLATAMSVATIAFWLWVLAQYGF